MHKFVFAALLALIAGPACADPFSAIGLLASYGTAAAGAGTFLTLSAGTWFWVGVAASACGADRTKARARRLGGAK